MDCLAFLWKDGKLIDLLRSLVIMALNIWSWQRQAVLFWSHSSNKVKIQTFLWTIEALPAHDGYNPNWNQCSEAQNIFICSSSLQYYSLRKKALHFFSHSRHSSISPSPLWSALRWLSVFSSPPATLLVMFRHVSGILYGYQESCLLFL